LKDAFGNVATGNATIEFNTNEKLKGPDKAIYKNGDQIKFLALR
jgi:hypothetical protein